MAISLRYFFGPSGRCSFAELKAAGATKLFAEKQSGEAARYMVASWKLLNGRKTTPALTVVEAAKQEKLTEAVLDRWVTYLSAKASETRPSLAGWRQALAGLDASKDLSADADALAVVEAAAK